MSLEEGLRNSGITKELLCLGLYTLVSWPESLCAPTRCKSWKGKSLAAYFCPGLGVKAFFRPWQWLVSQLLTGPRCQGSQTLKITSVAVLTAVWSHSCDQDLQFLFSSSAPALHPLPLLTLLFSGRSLSALVQLLLPLPSGRFPFLQLSWLPDPVSTSPSAPKQLTALLLLQCGWQTTRLSWILPPPLLSLHVTRQPSALARPFKGSLSWDPTVRCQESSMESVSSPPHSHPCMQAHQGQLTI